MRFKRWQFNLIRILLFYVLPVLLLTAEVVYSVNNCFMLLMMINMCLFIYLYYRCNQWEFTWIPMRYIYIFVFWGIAFYKIIFNINKIDTQKNSYMQLATSIMIFSILVWIIVKVKKACKKPKNCIKLQFPYKKGKYLITDGGDGASASIINYHYKSMVHGKHNTQKSMRFAVDIVKLNKFYLSAKTISRKNKEDYESFDEEVYSPIDGVIVKAVDGIHDNEPFPGIKNIQYNIGNCIVIKKENLYLILGHFKNGTILKKEGDIIKSGELIGCSGCSGLSPRPEIHMQLVKSNDENYWEGEGVPFEFEYGEYPTKNVLITL